MLSSLAGRVPRNGPGPGLESDNHIIGSHTREPDTSGHKVTLSSGSYIFDYGVSEKFQQFPTRHVASLALR